MATTHRPHPSIIIAHIQNGLLLAIPLCFIAGAGLLAFVPIVALVVVFPLNLVSGLYFLLFKRTDYPTKMSYYIGISLIISLLALTQLDLPFVSG